MKKLMTVFVLAFLSSQAVRADFDQKPGAIGGKGQINSLWVPVMLTRAQARKVIPAQLQLPEADLLLPNQVLAVVYLGRNSDTQSGLFGAWLPAPKFDYNEIFVAIPSIPHPTQPGKTGVYLHKILLNHSLALMSGALYRFPATKMPIAFDTENLRVRAASELGELSASFEGASDWRGTDFPLVSDWWKSLTADWITVDKKGGLHCAPFSWDTEDSEFRVVFGDLAWSGDLLGIGRAPGAYTPGFQVTSKWRVAKPGRCK